MDAIIGVNMILLANFHVNVIISKFPLSMKDFRTKMMWKKEDVMLEKLIHYL